MNAQVHLTYYDTAMMLIEIGPLRLLTDPVFDVAGTIFEYGPVRLEKTNQPPVQPVELGRIDAVLLSHDQHADNFDDGGRRFAATVPRVLTTRLGATRLPGGRATGLEPWEETTLESADGFRLTVTAMPAQHGPDGTQEATGPVTGFLLRWAGDAGGGLYISGDTVPFAGTEEIARRIAPVDLAVLSIGRVQLAPLGEAQLSFTAAEAVTYAEALGATTVVPMHFEGWKHFTEGEAAAKRVFAGSSIAGQVRFLRRGEATAFDL